MFDWLRRLFKRKDIAIEVRQAPKLKEPEPSVSQPFKYTPYPSQKKFLDSLDSPKYIEIQRVNLERQRATLGYGLKSRNFKPRPAYEKRLWKLDKKPDDED